MNSVSLEVFARTTTSTQRKGRYALEGRKLKIGSDEQS